jgi:calcium-dependent protein kinase
MSTNRYTHKTHLSKALLGNILTARRWYTGEEYEEVVMKILSLHRIDNRKRFISEDPHRELEVLSRLNSDGGHRSVVRLIEGFETTNDLVLVMEKLHRDLCDVVMDDGILQECQARKYFLDTIDGLHFIHSHGIAHRDLSLENLLLGSDGRVVITDFGLCCDCAAGVMQKDKVGKGFYMSPEIYADAGAYDAQKADVWSLGIILFIMMTGTPPMDVPSRSDARFCMVQQGKMADMLRDWQVLSYFSDDCLDLLNKMLCVDPAKRISLSQVMTHPWVKSGLQKDIPDNDVEELNNDVERLTMQKDGSSCEEGTTQSCGPHE